MPVEIRTLDENEGGDPGERLQGKMAHDGMLELHLREPLGVDGGELLLGLELVLDDVVYLGKRVGLAHASYFGFRHVGSGRVSIGLSGAGAGGGFGGRGLLFELVVSGRQGGDVGVGLIFGLAEQVHAIALIEPGGDAAVKGSAARGGDDGDLAAAGLGVVLFHGGFVGGELILDLAALVAADAGKLFVGVVELIVSELELGFGQVEIVGVGDCAVGLFQRGGEGVDVTLILLDHGLELRDFLLDREGFAGQGVGSERGLAKGEGEGLVDCVVGETFGFVGERLLFGGDSEWGEGLDGLPGALIDEIAGGSLGCALRTEKRHVRHGAARPPGSRETEDEEGCGYRDCESAKKLHSSTLHVWTFGARPRTGEAM